jgi:hypothetical protein
MRRLLATCALLLVTGCTSGEPRRPRASVYNPRPQLVVSIVLDQVGTVVLERYLERLPADGVIRRAMREGTFHHRVRYTHASTYTAPGHAVIYTGATPNEAGLMGNRVWDAQRGRVVSAVDDGLHPVLGNANEFASPSVLRVRGVADMLKEATQGRAHIVAISLKDRCAVLPGGAHPDVALWYDEDSRRFTTSSYYADSLPAWLSRWQSTHPAHSYFTIWNLFNDEEQTGMTDGAAGEGNWHGLGTRFPHDLARATEPYSAILATPQGSTMLIDIAKQAVARYRLGQDEDPDLLAISISGTDYVGHVFGAESLEALDNLIRVDRMLGAWMRTLSLQTRLAVLITADHGVSLRPETSRTQGRDAHRLEPSVIEREVDAALDAELGAETWVDKFVQPLLYLSARAKRDDVRARAMQIATQVLNALPGVYGAYDVRETAGWANSPDPLQRAIGLGTYRGTNGDIFLVPAQDSFVDEHMPEGSGTSHGSPWPYDTDVPVLMFGAGVTRMETQAPMDATRIAPTLSALLAIPPPPNAHLPALPGLLNRDLPRSAARNQ